MPDYKVSIIIPTYNVDKYIARAMQSLLDQTIGFESLQIIFVDDCSTDKSWEIICDYKTKYENVFAYRLLKNSGSAGTPRNKGLEFVESKYVMFLDPDDMYEIDACDLLYTKMEADEELDIVSGFCNYINSDSGVCEKVRCFDFMYSKVYRISCDDDFRSLVRYCSYYFCTKIFKISIIKRYNIAFPDISNYEDVVFMIRYLLKAKNAFYIDHPVYKYFFRNDSATNSLNINSIVAVSTGCKLIQKIFSEANKDKFFLDFVNEMNVLGYFFDLLPNMNLSLEDISTIKNEYQWLCRYYQANQIEISGEYGKIIFETMLHENYNSVFDVYKCLNVIKEYVRNLEKSKVWFLEQINNKDKEIENLVAANTKLKNWTDELEKSKAWFLDQIELKNKMITEYENELELRNAKIEKLVTIKNYYEQPFYKRWFARKPNFTEED